MKKTDILFLYVQTLPLSLSLSVSFFTRSGTFRLYSLSPVSLDYTIHKTLFFTFPNLFHTQVMTFSVEYTLQYANSSLTLLYTSR